MVQTDSTNGLDRLINPQAEFINVSDRINSWLRQTQFMAQRDSLMALTDGIFGSSNNDFCRGQCAVPLQECGAKQPAEWKNLKL